MTAHVSAQYDAPDRADRGAHRYVVRATHAGLLMPPPNGPGTRPARCDAVVVPAHDRADRLGFAARLAALLRCPLLVMGTSGLQRPVAGALRSLRAGSPVAVLALPHAGDMPTLVPRCRDEAGAASPKYRDLSTKRNTAMAIARMTGWRNVLLLDDDIRRLSPTAVRTALGWLGGTSRTRVVSWRSAHFPDNSAVCHAGRLAEVEQGVFVGSGAMGVRVDDDVPWFPPVYNEDWCFLVEPLAERRVVLAGDVRQLPYDPFDRVVDRGWHEEFGDVLGEGVYHLLHIGADAAAAQDEEYWADVVAQRRRFIAGIAEELGRKLARNPTPAARRRTDDALDCLARALARHTPTLHLELASFTTSWLADRAAWRDWLGELPPVECLAEAVARLGWRPEEHLLELR